MDMEHLQKEYSVRGKNGIAFLLAGTVLWLCFTMVYIQSFDMRIKNVIVLLLTALLFPLSLGISKMIKADWKQEGHPLNRLGLVFNFAQFAYFPIVFWSFLKMPDQMIMIFAIISGAHFFPYGWLYQATGYYAMAFVIACSIMVVGWAVSPVQLWLIPMLMVVFLLILILWLWVDYKRKIA